MVLNHNMSVIISKSFTITEDTEGMEGLVAQLDVWNFDIFRFNTITKDHPLVSLSYTILQVRALYY